MMDDVKALEREVTERLVASLSDDPQAWQWRDGNFDMLNGPGGITLSANYFSIYQPERMRFGFWNRRRIRRAFKRWKATAGNDLANKERYRALLMLRRCLSPMSIAA